MFVVCALTPSVYGLSSNLLKFCSVKKKTRIWSASMHVICWRDINKLDTESHTFKSADSPSLQTLLSKLSTLILMNEIYFSKFIKNHMHNSIKP